MHHHTHEIMALCAALDADYRACLLAIGRGMLAKSQPAKRPVLNLLAFSGKPSEKLLSDAIVGTEDCQIIELFGKPVSR
jgi:hypothetical protein